MVRPAESPSWYPGGGSSTWPGLHEGRGETSGEKRWRRKSLSPEAKDDQPHRGCRCVSRTVRRAAVVRGEMAASARSSRPTWGNAASNCTAVRLIVQGNVLMLAGWSVALSWEPTFLLVLRALVRFPSVPNVAMGLSPHLVEGLSAIVGASSSLTGRPIKQDTQ